MNKQQYNIQDRHNRLAGYRNRPALIGEQTPYREVCRLLFRLGERFERAQLVKDYSTMIAVDCRLSEIANAYPDLWIDPIVCMGQNNIRKFHNLEELHV